MNGSGPICYTLHAFRLDVRESSLLREQPVMALVYAADRTAAWDLARGLLLKEHGYYFWLESSDVHPFDSKSGVYPVDLTHPAWSQVPCTKKSPLRQPED